ncbi:hypothetical protein LLG95_12135 [bacterium]|nr:hypothetical protein [bacterium]
MMGLANEIGARLAATPNHTLQILRRFRNGHESLTTEYLARQSRNQKMQTRNTRKKSTKKHEKDFCRREAAFGREAENISEQKN